MFTLSEITAVKSFLEIISKMRGAYATFKSAKTSKIDLHNVIEKYFAFEGLPGNKVSLEGRLSNYTITTNFPVYSPRIVKDGKITQNEISGENSLEFKTMALNVPALVHNQISLDDGSKARIIWLYSSENTGLLFKNIPKESKESRNPLSFENLTNLFSIENHDKPLPVLVDIDLPFEEFLYTTAKITGRVVTAPLRHFEELSSILNPFFLNYYSNCIRPFSNVEGVLAIDVRRPHGKIQKIDNKKAGFKIIYSIQALIQIPETAHVEKKIILATCINGIPDRQGIPTDIKSITDGSSEKINTILTIGEISWQYSENLNSIAAFIELDVSDGYDSQIKITKLVHHWSIFQTKAQQFVKDKFGISIEIQPLICSNNIHKNNFNAKGLVIPKKIELAIFNESPIIRNGIDWLGISVGR
ncbi:MAG: hypothetical protein ABIN01_25785 [Ferruginibacter sp.]